MEEPAEVRVGRGQRLIEAVREDLELFGVAELEERIEVLQAEIARVEAQIDRKQAGPRGGRRPVRLVRAACEVAMMRLASAWHAGCTSAVPTCDRLAAAE